MLLDGVGIVSLDVESMYNNMSTELDRGACENFLSASTNHDGNEVSTNSILVSLDLCMKNNFFTFNDKIYKQKGGVGTGIKLAPPYDCIVMGEYEKLILMIF